MGFQEQSLAMSAAMPKLPCRLLKILALGGFLDRVNVLKQTAKTCANGMRFLGNVYYSTLLILGSALSGQRPVSVDLYMCSLIAAWTDRSTTCAVWRVSWAMLRWLALLYKQL